MAARIILLMLVLMLALATAAPALAGHISDYRAQTNGHVPDH